MVLKAKVIRKELGFSLIDVVRGTTLGYSHVQRFENGKQRMSQEKLLELSRFYGVTINDLLADADDAQGVTYLKQEATA